MAIQLYDGQVNKWFDQLHNFGHDLKKITPGDMFWDIAADLKLIVGISLFTALSMFVPYLDSSIIRSALGFGMVMFVPGYSFIAALFPNKKTIDGIERFALSVAFSFVILSFIGLGLNFTKWGIRLTPIVLSLVVFTIIFSFIANIQRHRITSEDRISFDIGKIYTKTVRYFFPPDSNRFDIVFVLILIVLVVGYTGETIYFGLLPVSTDKYSELYLLGPNGTADQYPHTVVFGDSTPVIVGIYNHEYRDVDYDLIVRLVNNSTSSDIHQGQVKLSNNQTYEDLLGITPDRIGNNMTVEFLLYEDGNLGKPTQECYLWINVTSRQAASVAPIVNASVSPVPASSKPVIRGGR